MTNEEIELALHDQGRQQRCAARYEWIRLHFHAAQFLLACHLDDPKSLDGAIDEQIQYHAWTAQSMSKCRNTTRPGYPVRDRHHRGRIRD